MQARLHSSSGCSLRSLLAQFKLCAGASPRVTTGLQFRLQRTFSFCCDCHCTRLRMCA